MGWNRPVAVVRSCWICCPVASISQSLHRTNVIALDEHAQLELGQRAAEILASTGLLSAVVTRRLEQGCILHGLLGVTVVQLYQEAV